MSPGGSYEVFDTFSVRHLLGEPGEGSSCSLESMVPGILLVVVAVLYVVFGVGHGH
jgi:hypothetical protein